MADLPVTLLTDEKCLDWLGEHTSRLEAIYWHIENNGGSVRQAIYRIAYLQDLHERSTRA